MNYYIKIYDDKKADIDSLEFKEKIAECFKKVILHDWDKLVKIDSYEEINCDKNNQTEYTTTFSLKMEYPETGCPR